MDRERRSSDAARNRRILGERDAQVPDVARLAGYLHALLLQLGDLRVDLGRPPAEMIDRPPWLGAARVLGRADQPTSSPAVVAARSQSCAPSCHSDVPGMRG